jgi:hypothetical protein
VTTWRQLNMFKGRRQRGERPADAPEFTVQCAVNKALTVGGDRGWDWTHFPAGELRDPVVAAKLKAAGLKPGWPDWLLVDPAGRLFGLELKRGHRSALSDAQKRLQARWQAKGVPYEVARGIDQALQILIGWGVLRVSL